MADEKDDSVAGGDAARGFRASDAPCGGGDDGPSGGASGRPGGIAGEGEPEPPPGSAEGEEELPAGSGSPSPESVPGEAGDEEPEEDDGSAPEIEPGQMQGIIEALLFSSDRPLGASRIAAIIGRGARGFHVRKAADALNEAYAAAGRTFRIGLIAQGLQMLTLPEYDEWILKLKSEERSAKLSEAALDILAVVAYRQPILKAEINHIRGVESGPLLRTLLEKNLVRIAGRADQPGRPMLYGTTKKFLEVFGLKSLGDLPKAEKLS